MIEQGHGHIINIASTLATVVLPATVYSATKFASGQSRREYGSKQGRPCAAPVLKFGIADTLRYRNPRDLDAV
jgi:NAD(P)-dependent dehydrogenase (short-subunit alcohol dehydrogenase family)